MTFRKSKLRFTIFVSCFISLLLIFLSFRIHDPYQDDLANPSRYNLQTTTAEASPRPKVFVIGLSKTGTTSLGDALALLDYRRLGWEDLRSRFLFRSYLRNDIAPYITLTQHYDAFEDLPWALVYRDMAQLYPDSKFILTLRADEQDWLTSIKGHTARRKWIGHEAVYGAYRADGNEEKYLEAYRNHTASVRGFFAEDEDSKRLLEWEIDGKETLGMSEKEKWGVLLEFLGMEKEDKVVEKLGRFPWTNRTASWRDKSILKSVWWMWDVFMYHFEEVSLRTLDCLGWLQGGMR